jgi:hypothetical protein
MQGKHRASNQRQFCCWEITDQEQNLKKKKNSELT